MYTINNSSFYTTVIKFVSDKLISSSLLLDEKFFLLHIWCRLRSVMKFFFKEIMNISSAGIIFNLYALTIRNFHLLENLMCFVFLLPPFWDVAFCLIADRIQAKSGVTKQKNRHFYLFVFIIRHSLRIVFWNKACRINVCRSFFNPLSASVAFTLKPINWFGQQINWLVSLWEPHMNLIG